MRGRGKIYAEHAKTCGSLLKSPGPRKPSQYVTADGKSLPALRITNMLSFPDHKVYWEVHGNDFMVCVST